MRKKAVILAVTAFVNRWWLPMKALKTIASGMFGAFINLVLIGSALSLTPSQSMLILFSKQTKLVFPSFTPASVSGMTLVEWFQPSLSTMYQSNACSGTLAAVSGDPIGCITNLGSNGSLVSLANDTTRPTLLFSGIYPYISCDGVNDILIRTSATGSYAAGSAVWMVSANANPGAGKTFMGDANNASTATAYWPFSTNSGSAQQESALVRNDGNTQVVTNAGALVAGAWTGSNNVVGWYDTGSNINASVNTTIGGTSGYTRSGTFTLDRFAICGIYRNGGVAANTAINIFSMVAYVSGTITTNDRAGLITYMTAVHP